MMNKILLSSEEVFKHKSPDSCWVIYKGGVYDVTSFLHSHPGGDEILLRYAGSDITEPFKEIGHSEQAEAILKKHFIGNLGEELDLENIGAGSGNSRLIDRIKQRLFTKEDRFGLHKMFGIVSLIGFVLVTLRVFQLDGVGTPFFSKPTFANLLILSGNFGLAMTSLMFHVPAKRHFTHIGTIEHQEQRFHSIIFSMRSISFVLWYMFEPILLLFFPIINAFLWVFRASILSIWHVLADLTTYKYAGLNGTTIRGAIEEKGEMNFIGTSLASIAQLGGILILLGFSATDPVSKTQLADLCYITLLPIQLIVFQLTLKRKGFLSDNVSAWLYMLELGIVALALAPGSRETFLIALYGLLRFIFQWNKYILFIAFAFLSQYFILEINPWLTLGLSILLLVLMRKKSRVQCFRTPTTVMCSIEKKTKLHENTYHLELSLPNGYAYKMPSGRHLALHIDEKTQRFYTPITYSPDGSKFEILAKTYPNGRANALIAATNVGDSLKFTGPYGDIFYAENKALRTGENIISLKNKSLLCIAGGSGITPIYSILSNLNNKISAELIYINRYKEDVLLLDKIKNFPKNIKVTYHLTKEIAEEENWFKKSHYNPKYIYADIALICGPPQFCETYKKLIIESNPLLQVFIF